MSLVEWTRIEPGQVEAVVALLVNREHPTTVRITPSRGDGGVDILGRGLGSTGGDVVWQVKSYTKGLDTNQKASIADSLDTVQSDERWAGLDVEEWRLVTPWNPSPEAENWLHDLGSAAGIPTVWHGLDHVEQLAARYPDVIDYYLSGGQGRVAEAQAEVMTLLGLERVNDGLSLGEVTTRIQTALGVLDHDPFYRFEFRFGEGTPPAPSVRPGLVMHTLRGDTGSGQWIVADIIARCASASDVAPITISGHVKAPAGSEAAEKWKDFLTYGTPVTLPPGMVSGTIDAPGGLGGTLDGAMMRTGPSSDADIGDDPEMHLQVLAPDLTVLAEVDIDRVERSEGIGGGVRVVLQEKHGIFTIEDRYDLRNEKMNRRFDTGTIVGLPVTVARAGIEVISHLHAPNSVRVSTRHAPPEHGIVDPNINFGFPTDKTEQTEKVLALLEDLCAIQTVSRSVVRTPTINAETQKQYTSWWEAAEMIRGKVVTATLPADAALTVGLESEVTPGDGMLRILLPHLVMVGDQEVDLGHFELLLNQPTLVDRTLNEDGTWDHTFATDGREVSRRRHDPTQAGPG